MDASLRKSFKTWGS